MDGNVTLLYLSYSPTFVPYCTLLIYPTYPRNMLMDCLAEGRGISLPALSVAAAKGVATTVGAYARIRKQFKVRTCINCIISI